VGAVLGSRGGFAIVVGTGGGAIVAAVETSTSTSWAVVTGAGLGLGSKRVEPLTRPAEAGGGSGWYSTTAKNKTITTLRPKLAGTFRFMGPCSATDAQGWKIRVRIHLIGLPAGKLQENVSARR
jgi:hypothetical protein